MTETDLLRISNPELFQGTPERAALLRRTHRVELARDSMRCQHCGACAQALSDGEAMVIAHPPSCNSNKPWAIFALRMQRQFACTQKIADGYAARFWPHIETLGGEDVILAAGRSGKLGRIQDRVAALESPKPRGPQNVKTETFEDVIATM